MSLIEDLFKLYCEVTPVTDPFLLGMRKAQMEEAMRQQMEMPVTQPWQKVLGLLPTATLQDAETAYKTLARKHHPDFGGDLMKMQEINEAIRVARLILKGSK